MATNEQKLFLFWMSIRDRMPEGGPGGSDLRDETMNDLIEYLPGQNRKNFAIALLKYFIPELENNVSVDEIMSRPIKAMFGLEEDADMDNDVEIDDAMPKWEDYRGGRKSRRLKRKSKRRKSRK